MNNVSFKAQFVDKVSVMAKKKNGKYAEKEVSFVKMNPHSLLDYNAVKGVNRNWGDGETYVRSMLYHFNIIADDQKKNIYFITEQDSNFRKLEPKKVLGMVEVSKFDDYSRIDFIQTKPGCMFKERERKYKNIGWSMLEMVEKIYGKHKIVLNSVRKAIKFYEKYGFVITYDKCVTPRMVLNRAVKR